MEWTVRHLNLEGEAVDRDRGYPDLEMEMHPLGTALPKKDQINHLKIRIGKSETWIGPDEINELRRFLDG